MIFAEFLVSDNAFKYLGRDWAEPANVFTAAHDMIEHFPDDNGTIEDELRALGSSLWLRSHMLDKDAHDIGGLLHDSHTRSVHNTAADIFGQLNRYNIKSLLPMTHEIKLDRMYLSLFDRVQALAASHTISDNLAELAVAWAKLGLMQALDRYKKAKVSVPVTFEKLRAEFAKYHRGWFNKPLKGKLSMIIDEIHGTIDSEFIPE